MPGTNRKRKLTNAFEMYREARRKQASKRDDSSDDSSSSEKSSVDEKSSGNEAPIVNKCMSCGVDMGDGNPRQLCGKTRCLNEEEDNIEPTPIAARTRSRRAAKDQGSDNENPNNENENAGNENENGSSSNEQSSGEKPSSLDEEAQGLVDEDCSEFEAGDGDLKSAGNYGHELLKEMVRESLSPGAMDKAREFAATAAQRKTEDKEKMLDAVAEKILDPPNLNDAQREEAKRIHAMIKNQKPTLETIIDLKISDLQKKRLVEKYMMLYSLDKYTDEYSEVCEQINALIAFYRGNEGKADLAPEDIINSNRSVDEKIQMLNNMHTMHSELGTLQRRALESGLPANVKAMIINEIKNMQQMNDNDNERATILKWVDNCLKLPTTTVPMPITPDASTEEKAAFEAKVVKQFDELCFGMKNVKERVLDYLFCKINSEDSVMPVLALVGSPGTGKTNIAECIAKILGRPLVRIKFGGEGDAVKLRGHTKSYIGSGPGEIVRSLQEARTRAPVILLDEIDKIGRKDTDGTQEVTSTLLHAVDTYRNNFTDSYLGFDIDLHDVIWVATMNNDRIVDRILMDRMDVVHIEPYSLRDKIAIANTFFVPDFTSKMRLPKDGVVVPVKTMQYIIEYVGKSDGLRGVKKALEMIFARITRMHGTGRIAAPFTITTEFFDKQAEIVGLKKNEHLSYFN